MTTETFKNFPAGDVVALGGSADIFMNDPRVEKFGQIAYAKCTMAASNNLARHIATQKGVTVINEFYGRAFRGAPLRIIASFYFYPL